MLENLNLMYPLWVEYSEETKSILQNLPISKQENKDNEENSTN